MGNTIILDVGRTLSCLAGYPVGEKIYKEQVRDRFNFDEEIAIVIPNHIEDIAISFIQGFCADMVERMGVKGTKDYVRFEHPDSVLVEEIYNYIE